MKNTAAMKLKQVPKGYLVMGIDPHKKRHAAVAMTQDFTTHSKFKFNNSKEGFEMALERPVHANPLNGREVVGAALNRLLRLAFALVKRQRSKWLEPLTKTI